MAREIETVGVVGLGTMGAGIAQLCMLGRRRDRRPGGDDGARRARRGSGSSGSSTARVEKGTLEAEARDAALARLPHDDRVGDLADCDLVIEAIVEELEPSRSSSRELDARCTPDAILATNTSALSVTEIAAAIERPERVVGMHFFNPAPLMPLVEIVRAERSDGGGRRGRVRVGGADAASSRCAATTRPASSSTGS